MCGRLEEDVLEKVEEKRSLRWARTTVPESGTRKIASRVAMICWG